MAKDTIASKVEKHFAGNLQSKEVHATADGFLFEQKQNALAHATTLENKEVSTFKPTGKVEKSLEDSDLLETAEIEAAKVAADKKEALAKVAEAKKLADDAKKASENTAGVKKHPATTGADQKTAK